MIRTVRLIIGLVALLLGSLGTAETLPPKPVGYYNDYAGIVDRATALQLNEELAQIDGVWLRREYRKR